MTLYINYNVMAHTLFNTHVTEDGATIMGNIEVIFRAVSMRLDIS